MVHVAAPPPLRAPDPLFHILPAGTYLTRIFDPARFGAQALTFRAFGPLTRFDHHEGIRRGKGRQAAASGTRRICCAAPTLSCCLVEVFGDRGVIAFGDLLVATPALTRDVRLLDLRGSGAMRAGTVAALAKVPDHRLGQAWSRHFYEDAAYQEAEGVLYLNAHNDEAVVALYERAEDALRCGPDDVTRLDDPALRYRILDIALENHLTVAPVPR